jgi:hypothetical protein
MVSSAYCTIGKGVPRFCGKGGRRFLTRARIRAPFDGKIISPKTQDNPTPLTMRRPRSTTSRKRFRKRRRKDPGQDPHW